MVVVAQLARAPDCESGSRWFESNQSPHKSPHSLIVEPLAFYQEVRSANLPGDAKIIVHFRRVM